MLARWRQRLGRLTNRIRAEFALAPELKHLDDGVCRWHFGDDPQQGDPNSEVW